MALPYRIGILGAGLGSRLRENAETKPLARVGGTTLLEAMLQRFLAAGAPEIHCALRDELLPPELRAQLPRLPKVHYHFVNTDSSLHTLGALITAMGGEGGPVLFTMADTVMREEDFHAFLSFCGALPAEENAVLLSRFVDDEKPLWVERAADGRVRSFGSTPTDAVTSGLYFLRPDAMRVALELLAQGTHKMRNFLANLASRGFPINSFVVDKTIDVDHPSDLQMAEAFLRGR